MNRFWMVMPHGHLWVVRSQEKSDAGGPVFQDKDDAIHLARDLATANRPAGVRIFEKDSPAFAEIEFPASETVK